MRKHRRLIDCGTYHSRAISSNGVQGRLAEDHMVMGTASKLWALATCTQIMRNLNGMPSQASAVNNVSCRVCYLIYGV